MSQLLLIATTGPSRPGLARDLSRAIAERDCAILDSRITTLDSEFAAHMLVRGHWAATARLEQELPREAAAMGLQILIARTTATSTVAGKLPYAIEVVCLERPDVVPVLTEFLAAREIEITEMTTERYVATGTGAAMFSVQISIGIPGDLHIAGLREEFLDLCDQNNLDAVLEPIKS